MPDDVPMDGDYTRGSLRPSPRVPWLPLAALALLGVAMLPVDGPTAMFCRRFQAGGDLALGGDLRRSLETLQQFGDLATCLIAGLVIALLDPPSRRYLPRAAVALASSAAIVHLAKLFVGRPRPYITYGGHAQAGVDSPLWFAGPWRTYPLPRATPEGIHYLSRHGWEFWNGISSDLASMPSSHTAAAAALACVLAARYPKLSPLVWAWASLVGLSRVVLGAHYPSDVLIGAACGCAAAALTLRWLLPRP